jgi:hypothetical protein
MALFQLIYMSSMETDDANTLPDILEEAVRNNKQRNITGMMLYTGGNILQVLEGEEDLVRETFRSIQLDKRHHGIFVLIENEIERKQFVSWSMGFKQLTKEDLEKFPSAAHVFKAHPDEVSVRGRPSDAVSILKSFAADYMSIY